MLLIRLLKIDQRKARERELATFDENRQAVGMLNPMRDKNEGTYRGGEATAPVTTAWKTSYELSKKGK